MTLAWSVSPDLGLRDLRAWAVAAYIFPIVATTASAPRTLKLICWGFVVGAVASVAIGLQQDELTSTASHFQRAVTSDGRLTGGEADPNYLAAGVVPAVVFAGALLTVTRPWSLRIVLLLAVAFLGLGLALTGSRGGFLAAGVAFVAALVVFHRRRARTLLIGLVAVAAMTIILSYNTGIWDRVTSADAKEGSGRVELWTAAWRMTQDYPVIGVGLNNFTVHSPQYVRRPGALEQAAALTENLHVVHSLYLQTLVEAGFIGLIALLVFLGSCVGSAYRAGTRLADAAEPQLSVVAKSIVVGVIGMLAGSVFLSNGADKRLWVLLGLCGGVAALSREVRATPAWAPSATLEAPRSIIRN
jgi:putative inorganic carbon (hco3(-)) transporter